MRTSKYINDPETLAQVERMERGECTRMQAAETLGISISSMNTRLARGGFLERLKGTRDYSGSNLFKPNPDKAKVYSEAVAEALLSPKLKVKQLWSKYPGLNYQTLAKKVREAKTLNRSPDDAISEETVKVLRHHLLGQARPTAAPK